MFLTFLESSAVVLLAIGFFSFLSFSFLSTCLVFFWIRFRMHNKTLFFILSLNHTFLTVFWQIIVLNFYTFLHYSSLFLFIQILICFHNSLSRFTSTLTLAQLILVLFFVAKFTYSGFPYAGASENTTSSPKLFGGSDEKISNKLLLWCPPRE
ncbi:hypothetical protein EJD97_006974 [Solanum chilense]|uniref:Uncharacterized protein n=1 Tax=Solanum chilense TaxID=4083 RepID=A0A6N2CA93_SOLCI|nr:hypothetical protein EJD97_006974 [Solanum chilense]